MYLEKAKIESKSLLLLRRRTTIDAVRRRWYLPLAHCWLFIVVFVIVGSVHSHTHSNANWVVSWLMFIIIMITSRSYFCQHVVVACSKTIYGERSGGYSRAKEASERKNHSQRAHIHMRSRWPAALKGKCFYFIFLVHFKCWVLLRVASYGFVLFKIYMFFICNLAHTHTLHGSLSLSLCLSRCRARTTLYVM